MPSANTLELAKQGDSAAIATILSYTLSQHYDATASVIRLGDYLSVLIQTSLSVEQGSTVRLIDDIFGALAIDDISTIEINAQDRGDRAMLWTQTLTAPFNGTPSFSLISPMSNPTIDLPSDLPNLLVQNPEAVSIADESIDPVQPIIPSLTDKDWNDSLQSILQRPEIVAMIAVAIVLVLWDSYLDWMDEVDAAAISGRQLAQRLGVSSSTISRYKERTNFGEWSQALDPEGMGWVYTGKGFVQREI
jgi:hypothetical protein